MTQLIGITLSLILPWLLGVIVVRIIPQGRSLHTTQQLAHGYLVGFLLCTLLIRLWGALAWPINFWALSATMGSFCVLAFSFASSVRPDILNLKGSGAPTVAGNSIWFARFAIGILVILIAWRFFNIATEALVRPILAWDAWAAWTPRTLQFFDSKSLDADLITIKGSHGLFANLVHLWGMLGAGTAQSTISGLHWVGAALAITLGVYGSLRSAALPVLIAVLGCYILVSMPFFDIHSMLVGYADIWVTLSFFLGMCCCGEFLHQQNKKNAALVIFYAILCVSIKQVGYGLAAILILCLIHCLLVRTSRGALLVPGLVAAGASALILLPHSTMSLQVVLPGSRQLVVNSQVLMLSDLATFPLKPYTPIGQYVIESLILFSNWHLLFWMCTIIFCLRIVSHNGKSILKSPVLLATALGLVYTWLYHGLVAPDGAIGHQGLSRSMLYFVPSLVCWLVVTSAAQWNEAMASKVNQTQLRD